MTTPATPRRAQIADAAITVLAKHGARGLTHRAVDARAGLPPGSTSYYYRTREALLVAAVERLAELDFDAGTAPIDAPHTVDGLLDLLTSAIVVQTTTGQARTIARYYLSLEAARYPSLRRTLDPAGARMLQTGTSLLAGAGIPHPERAARAILAVAAGIVYESTVGGRLAFTEHEIKALLAAHLPA